MGFGSAASFVVNATFNKSRFDSDLHQAQLAVSDFADYTKEALQNFDLRDNVTNGISSLATALKNVGLGGMAESVDFISDRFTTLGVIGTAVLEELATQAVHAGEKIVSALTIDQVTAGWTKYEQKTTAVQTIMAATANLIGTVFTDSAQQMEYVNQQLEKLNWFTDETSYNFVDMVSTIGNFTAAGVGLDQAVTSMQGMATWAAISGQNAETASRVMAQLAQSLGAGFIKGQDWASVQSATMDTMEFKQAVIDTAVEMGKLEKVAENTYRAVGAKTSKTDPHTFSVESMSTYMTTDKWFTTEVLNKVLNSYGDLTNQVYALTEATDLSATDILTLVEHFKDGSMTAEEFEEALSNTSMTAEEFSDVIANLGSEANDLGFRALKAAQEAKTLSDAIGAVKENASTAWMNIFETIFGDYESQRKLWTRLANYLYDVFVSPLENVQEVLDRWVAKGAQSTFIEGLAKIGPSLLSFADPIKKAFNDIFFPLLDGDQRLELIANKLVEFTNNFSSFFDEIVMGEETAAKVENVFEGLFSIFKMGSSILSEFGKAVSPVFTSLGHLGREILDLASDIGEYISSINFTLGISEKLSPVVSRLSNMVDLLANSLDNIFSTIQNSYREGGGGLTGLFHVVREGIASAINLGGELFKSLTGWDFSGIFGKIGQALQVVIDGISWLAQKIIDANPFGLFKKNADEVSDTTEKLSKKVEGVTLTFDDLKEKLRPVADFFAGIKESISNKFSGIIDWVKGLGEAFLSMNIFDFGRLKWILNWLKEMFSLKSSYSGGASGLSGTINNIVSSIRELAVGFTSWNLSGITGLIMNIAMAIGILAVALIVLANIPLGDLTKALAAINELIVVLTTAIGGLYLLLEKNPLKMLNPTAEINSLVDSAAIATLTSGMLKMALAVGILAIALKSLSGLKPEELVQGFASIAAMMTALVLVMYALSKFDTTGMGKVGGAMLLMSIGVLALSAAMKIFSSINWQDAIVGFTLFAATMVIIVAALELLTVAAGTSAAPLLAAAAALLITAVAVGALAAAVVVFSIAANMEGFQSGLIGMATGLLAMVVALGLLGKYVTGALAAAAALLVLAVAIDLLAVALIALSLVPADQLMDAIVALGSAMLIMGVALAVLTPLGPAALVVAAALAVVAVAIVVAAAALLVFGVAMNTLSAVEWTAIGNGIDEVVIQLLALSAVGAVAGVVAVGLIAFSAALATTGAALIIFNPAIAALNNAGVAIVGNSMMEIASAGPGLVVTAGAMAALAVQFGLFTIEVKSLSKNIDNMVKSLEKTGPSVVQFGTAMTGITTATTTASTSVQNMVTTIANCCGIAVTTMTTAGYNMVNAMTSGMASGVSVVYAWGVNLSSNAYQGANSYTGMFYGIGQNISEGMANGIYSKAWRVRDEANRLASMVNSTVRSALGVRSPSRVFMQIGKYLDEGLAIGLERNTGMVTDAASIMATTAIDLVDSILNSDDAMTITPVLDLSQIESGARDIGSMLNTTGALTASSQISSNLSKLQNGNSDSAMVVTLDPTAMAALTKNQSNDVKVNVNFNGRLSSLAAVLQPAIEAETNRLGPSLVHE